MIVADCGCGLLLLVLVLLVDVFVCCLWLFVVGVANCGWVMLLFTIFGVWRCALLAVVVCG